MLVEVDGLGPTCFCHGSPRSDEECVTERTPAERVREFMAGVDASAVVTGHVHVSYDRVVDGIRTIGPGSVGLPYEAGPGARWALLGPDVELRRTDYDVEAAVALMRATDDPRVETDRRADARSAVARRCDRGRRATRVRRLGQDCPACRRIR